MRLAALAVLGTSLGSCKSCLETRNDDRRVDESSSDPDEADDLRKNFWRMRVAITGAGDATTADGRIACHGTALEVTGACGPVLFEFDERTPPLVHATAARGWRFVRWSSMLTEPDGSTHPRAGRMPDGLVYLNGFGYADTGELETVTAVFTEAP